MNENITSFLKQQTCASVCCIDAQEKPYCFSCFYAFNSEEGLLYFKSSPQSQHSVIMKENPLVAGTILPDKLNKLMVKGIQFEGIVLDAAQLQVKQAMIRYFKKHPLALAFPGELWVVQINHIKMTDSTLGFGKKIIWSRVEALNVV